MEVADAVERNCEKDLQERVQKAVDLIRRSIELYGLPGLAFSFNGGKDSTVLLHLTRLAVALHKEEHGAGDAEGEGDLGGIYTFFYDHGDDFQELYDFVRNADSQYGLGMETLTVPYKEGLQQIISQRPVKGIILGTRRGDPNAGDQEHFSPSTKGWPAFMRVNPVLEWTYHEVWTFLLATGVPYCSLYDQGYTSIGSTSTTVPNDLLRREDGSFAHARFLADARQERAGRIKKSSSMRPAGNAALSRSVAILVIGDELLSGKVDETNSHFLARKLREIGWKLGKISVVPDDMDAISRAARTMSDHYEVVVTSGGIGPTVDDITIPAISRAFNLNVIRKPELEQRLKQYFGEEATTEYHLKMAEVPDNWDVEILEIGDIDTPKGPMKNPFPVIRVKNIFVLPGIPALLKKKWAAVASHIGQLAPFHNITIRLSISDETCIAPSLKAIAADMGSNVSVGSYPVEAQADGAGIVLCLESKDQALLISAAADLKALLPADCVISEQMASEGPSSIQSSLDALPVLADDCGGCSKASCMAAAEKR